jgi:hypothetical protein
MWRVWENNGLLNGANSTWNNSAIKPFRLTHTHTHAQTTQHKNNHGRGTVDPNQINILKGTVSRDFRPSVFFVNRSPLGPRLTP